MEFDTKTKIRENIPFPTPAHGVRNRLPAFYGSGPLTVSAYRQNRAFGRRSVSCYNRIEPISEKVLVQL